MDVIVSNQNLYKRISNENQDELYFDALKECNKVAGEENINEFIPYSLLSIANKIFYATLFILYFEEVVNGGGGSANGVTYNSTAVNTINASSVTITGFALMALCGLSGRNAWLFRKVVQKLDISSAMKSSIISMNNIRGLKIFHTAVASVVNMANGIFQLIDYGSFSNNAEVRSIGKTLAKHTAVPALLLILSKNLFDFISTANELINCRSNILSIRNELYLPKLLENKELKSVDFRSYIVPKSNFGDCIISYLTQKSRDLTYTAISTGLVSLGMVSLFLGIMGFVPVRITVSIFLITATAGQMIAVATSDQFVRLITIITECFSKLVKKDKNTELFLEPILDNETSMKKDKSLFINNISIDLRKNGPSTDLITKLQSSFFCIALEPDEERENGLEGFTKVIS